MRRRRFSGGIGNVTVYLDRDSAALLDAATRGPVRERDGE